MALVVYGFESPDWSGAIWVGLIWFLVAFLRERGRDARVLKRLEAEARKRAHEAAA